MAQICPNCQTSNSDSAALCKKCGNPLPNAVAAKSSSNGASKTVFRPSGAANTTKPTTSAKPTTSTTGSAAKPASPANTSAPSDAAGPASATSAANTARPTTAAPRPSSGAIAEAARRAAAQQKAAQETTTQGANPAGATTRPRAATVAAGGAGRRQAAALPGGAVTRGLNNALDQAGLPRFSTPRYLVIWAVALVLILGTVALLVFFGAASNRAAAAPTPLPGVVASGKFATVDTAKGSFKLQLSTDPVMKDVVQNFRNKVASGFYNGLTFHRVEPVVVQGGDPKGNGTGGGTQAAAYNNQPFVRGAVGMASQGAHAPRINDAQWFITKQDHTEWNNNYANFATVTTGMDVVDQLAIGDKINTITLSDN